MKTLKLLLVALALSLAACASVPRGDVILDAGPVIASQAAYLVESLGLSKPVWIQDSEDLAERGLLGQSWPSDDVYVVLIRADLDPAGKWMVLEHELGHVLVWDGGLGDSSDHGPAWGQAFARVHRVATGEVSSAEDSIARIPR